MNYETIIYESFCGGFDFSDGLQHFESYGINANPTLYDPGVDMMTSFNPHAGPTQRFMSIWRSPKPVVVKV